MSNKSLTKRLGGIRNGNVTDEIMWKKNLKVAKLLNVSTMPNSVKMIIMLSSQLFSGDKEMRKTTLANVILEKRIAWDNICNCCDVDISLHKIWESCLTWKVQQQVLSDMHSLLNDKRD